MSSTVCRPEEYREDTGTAMYNAVVAHVLCINDHKCERLLLHVYVAALREV